MRQATVWDIPEDSTFTAVANSVMRETNSKAPNVFHYDAASADRGRVNAARTSHEKAVARKQARERKS